MTREVPQKRLGDLFIFKNGRAFKKEEWATTGLPIIRIQNLNSKDAPFNHFAGEYSSDIFVEPGDLLFSWSGTVGSSFGSHLWDRQPGVLNQHIFKIGFKEQIDSRYAFYALREITAAIEESVSGAVGLVHITKERLNEFTLPVPPLAEQQRIVGVLDEAFAGIATAQAHAEKNLQNARALFESHLQSVFTQRGEGWMEKKLGELAEFKNGLNFTRQSKGQTLRIVGVGDFQDHTVVPTDALQSVTIDGKLSDDYLIRRDDILTVRSNGSKDLVGRCMLVPDVDGMTSYSGFIIRIRFDTRTISPRFLLRFMKSSETRAQLNRDGGGANISNINQAKLAGLPISLPSFSQQENIADKLDALSTETQRLESLYRQKLAALAALKKALLHQAFSGELTDGRRESKVIPFPVVVSGITTTDLHAGILAMAYQVHERHGKQAEFGHVKGEKISHLMEALVGIDLGRVPFKDAAGPNDFPHLQKVEHRARMAGYFLFQRVDDAGYRVTKHTKFDELITRTELMLGELLVDVERVLELMWPMTTRQAEIFATVFAAWNNLLLDGEFISDERIVREAREDWHPDKLKIPRENFFHAIAWMKDKGLCPEGKGKKVLSKAVKKKR